MAIIVMILLACGEERSGDPPSQPSPEGSALSDRSSLDLVLERVWDGKFVSATRFNTIWQGRQVPAFHYVVAIGRRERNGRFLLDCTGIAIARDRVLTAGHCVQGCRTSNLWVTDLPDVANVDERVWEVESAVRHHDYKRLGRDDPRGRRYLHDVAVLLVPDAELTPWRMTEVERIEETYSGWKVGYGWSIADGWEVHGERLAGSGRVMPGSLPRELAFGFTSTGLMTCEYDSGGPTFLTENGQPTLLVGITSSLINPRRPGRIPDGKSPRPGGMAVCSARALDVAVYDYLEWIDKAMNGECTCSGC